MSDREPYVVKPEHHTTIGFLGLRIVPLLDHAATPGGQELFLVSGAEGAGPKPHAHDWDEAYYMIEGEMELVSPGSAPRAVGVGELAVVPRGALHGFRITTPRASFVEINSGRGAAEFFAEGARLMGDVVDLPKLLDLARRHAIRVPPPPPAAS